MSKAEKRIPVTEDRFHELGELEDDSYPGGGTGDKERFPSMAKNAIDYTLAGYTRLSTIGYCIFGIDWSGND